MTFSDYVFWKRVFRSVQRFVPAVVSFFVFGALMIEYVFPVIGFDVVIFNINLVDVLVIITFFVSLSFIGVGFDPTEDIAPARYGDYPVADGLLVGFLAAGMMFSLVLGISYTLKVLDMIFAEFIQFISMISY